MKIVSWNLKNVGNNKLANTFNPAITVAGLGNNVGDYIMNVVMSRPVWNNILSAALPDVFVIVELKSGGSTKGVAANGTAIPTLATLVAGMNAVANAGLVPPNTNPNYQYAAVLPLVIGYHETVGVIYNTRSLNYVNSGILRDNVNNVNFLPRAPFWAEFTDDGGTTYDLVGLHAPPPGGAPPNFYKPGIQYANVLTRSTQLDLANQMMPENTFVMGDFNCDPTYTYGNPAVGFAMAGYATSLAAVTLSSMRAAVVNGNPQPSNYLKDAYDNLMHAFPNGAPVGGVTERVPDLIGNARNVNVAPVQPMYPGNVVMLLNNYWVVSDHLPVIFEF